MMSGLNKFWVVIAIVLLAGCVAFPQHQVANSPVVARSYQQDLVYVEVHAYHGLPGKAVADDLAYGAMVGLALQAFHDSGRFGMVSFSEADRAKANQQYRLSVYENTPRAWPIVTGVLCVFSYDLFPFFASQHYTVVLERMDAQSHQTLMRTENTDTIHHYFGWLAVPAWIMGKSTAIAQVNTLENQIRAAIANLPDRSDDQ
ncbi:MAG: hypothetical protein HKM02_09775 [Pseudomonadales bacterium]|nr:hypothetical protein [Pseudomonadales bacterium]